MRNLPPPTRFVPGAGAFFFGVWYVEVRVAKSELERTRRPGVPSLTILGEIASNLETGSVPNIVRGGNLGECAQRMAR